MYKVMRLAFLLSLAMVLQQGCRQDSSSTETQTALASISVREYPRRIVSMAPSNTETLLSLGLRENLVGVTDFYGDVEKVRGLPRVGGYTNPSVERIVALKPDIVFAARGNPRDVIAQLRRHGVPVFCLDTRSVSQLLSDVETVGRLTGVSDPANRLTAAIREEMQRIREKVDALNENDRPRVLWVGQEEPLRTAGPGSLVDELIILAGGDNVARNERDAWPSLSLEKLVLADPDVLILGEDKYKESPDKVRDTLSRFRRHPVWQNVSAVREGRVHAIPTDLLGQPSPAFILGLKELARRLHPNLFPELDSTSGSDGKEDAK
jgi:iron complex transport system substrate-binding protein